jgi:hypothetical protein
MSPNKPAKGLSGGYASAKAHPIATGQHTGERENLEPLPSTPMTAKAPPQRASTLSLSFPPLLFLPSCAALFVGG